MRKSIQPIRSKDLVIVENEEEVDKDVIDFKSHISSLYRSDPKFAYPPIAFIKDNDPWKTISAAIINPLAPKHALFNY